MQPSTEGTAPAPVDQRILSVDALRGFDMFWIVGGSGFVASILAFCPPAVRDAVLPQLEHVDWDGFHFCDLIFPLFLFVVGMTTVFSLTKTVARHGVASAYRRIIPRFIILFLLGVFYSNGLADAWPEVRLLGAYIPKTDEPNFHAVPEMVEALVGQPFYATVKADGSSGTVFWDDDGVVRGCSRTSN